MSTDCDALPVSYGSEVSSIYPDFAVSSEKAARFVNDPDGPIGLTPESLDASMIVDARNRIRSNGSIYDTSLPQGKLLNRLLNRKKSLRPDSLVIRVGVRRAILGVRTPEEIETTVVHELTHARQIRNGEVSLRVGRAVMGTMLTLGYAAGPAIEAATQKDMGPLLTALNSILGLSLGKSVGDWLAPHEREARKVARETPYLGIVEGTRNPDYPETLREKIQRNQDMSESRVKSLFWGALGKIATHA